MVYRDFFTVIRLRAAGVEHPVPHPTSQHGRKLQMETLSHSRHWHFVFQTAGFHAPVSTGRQASGVLKSVIHRSLKRVKTSPATSSGPWINLFHAMSIAAPARRAPAEVLRWQFSEYGNARPSAAQRFSISSTFSTPHVGKEVAQRFLDIFCDPPSPYWSASSS